MRAMARDAEAEKTGIENGGKLPLANRTRQRPTHKKPTTNFANEVRKLITNEVS